MVFIRGPNAPSIRMTFVVILSLYLCNVHSQETSATDETSSVTTNISTVESPGTTDTEGPTSTYGSSVSTSPVTGSSEESATNAYETTSATTIDSTETGSTDASYTSELSTTTITTTTTTTTSTSSTTTTSNADSLTICPPGQFPFVNKCLTPGENGGVVITAFILSIISFIGVIGAASYMLFFRKYFSSKKGRLLTNYNVPDQELGKVDTTAGSSHNRQHGSRRPSLKKQVKPNHRRQYSSTLTDPDRARPPSMFDEEAVANNAKLKQQGPPLGRSNLSKEWKQMQQGQTNNTDTDDDRF